MKDFTTYLKEYREKHKISSRILAELLHIAPSTLVHWLQGNPPHPLAQKGAIIELEQMEARISKIRSKTEPFYDLCIYSLNKIPDAVTWTIIVNPVIATWEITEKGTSKLSIHYKEPRHIKTEVSTKETIRLLQKEFKKFSGITTWEEKNLEIKHNKTEGETIEFTLRNNAPWTETLNLENYKSPLVLIPHFQTTPNTFLHNNRKLKTPKKPHCIYPLCKTCWQSTNPRQG
jgi:hypothetical protein